MSKLKVRQGDWVVVCDGKKALVLENVGDEKFLDLKTREVFEHATQTVKTHDLTHSQTVTLQKLVKTLPAAQKNLELFSTQVMPHFRG